MNESVKIIEGIYQSLLDGNLTKITFENKQLINSIVAGLLDIANPTEIQIYLMELILKISNILYNNCSDNFLVLEDGTYDLLLEHYRKFNNDQYPVGAPPIEFKQDYVQTEELSEKKVLYHRLDFKDPLYFENIRKNPQMAVDDYKSLYMRDIDATKIGRNVSHEYPKLVGTLDKCKFVLNKQAEDAGVLYDDNVKIFERDFIHKHLDMGIIKPDQKFIMIAELKYDGISVEATVSDKVISARSRGDTANDLATDMTHILEGYPFPRVCGRNIEPFGMKFEAILTYANLAKLSELKGKKYANCRNAIISIIGSLDGRKYRDLITLVPLATSEEMDRLLEIEFMNSCYVSGESLRYAVLYGNYKEILFQVKRFVEEAEYLRPIMPFMYDGVVVSYQDPRIIKALGRENSVNKYSIAIKFNALKKQTVFTGYSYTIGQNGLITPMIHYMPVEFYGTIHTKSSGHSFKRFNELALKPGDIITVQYTNDVMPYVTKPDIEANQNNPNPPMKFITHCPFCGTQLQSSDSGKSIYCPNLRCGERNFIRMGNFLDKMNFKDFSRQSIKSLGIDSLKALLEVTSCDSVLKETLGEILADKFKAKVQYMLSMPIYDYEIVGSIGFSSVAIAKWKLIFKHITIEELLSIPRENLRSTLLSIKGIGPGIADTIITELPFFEEDLRLITYMWKVKSFKGNRSSMKIRFTGFRDADLVKLVKLKYDTVDIGEGAVTKDTNILLVPGEGFTSTKTIKAAKDGVQIVPVTEFRANMDLYLL